MMRKIPPLLLTQGIKITASYRAEQAVGRSQVRFYRKAKVKK